MTTVERPALFQHLWKSTLVSGVLSVIFGVLVLVWPGISVLAVAVLFGAYLLISGLSQVFSAFTQHASAGGRVLLFISGAASLILAVLAFGTSAMPSCCSRSGSASASSSAASRPPWRRSAIPVFRGASGRSSRGHRNHRRRRGDGVAVHVAGDPCARRWYLADRHRGLRGHLLARNPTCGQEHGRLPRSTGRDESNAPTLTPNRLAP